VRSAVLALALALAASLAAPAIARAQAKAPPGTHTADGLARARALDQQGAKAYADGRYNDAIRYFEEAFRLGGPAFEQWNIAKCYLRLDQPEQAADMLQQYLDTPDLPPGDRKEAEQQLDELRKRPSTLTVSSAPTGATVTVDGNPVDGKTPLSTSVAPGPHVISVTTPKHVTYTKDVEAKFGHAIILDAPLSAEGTGPGGAPYGAGPRWAVSAWLGVDLPKHGDVTTSAEPGGIVSGTYRFANVGPAIFTAGAAVLVTGDSWSNTVKAPTTIAGCPSLADGQSATALSLFGVVTGGWEVFSKLHLSALGGAGAALYFTGSDVGGDLFAPSCTAQTGARPALLVAAQIDYNLTPTVRLSALPIALQFHRGFAGVRTAPLDASGLWLRAVIAIGAGVDF
jgi:hypothetical protein